MEAFLEVEEFRATARHIELLTRKRDSLSRALEDSWAQLLTAAARKYSTGEIDEFGLLDLYESMRDGHGGGFCTTWDAHMPHPASRVRYWRNELPNGPKGSWVGEIPLSGDRPAPPTGFSVVYVLFDVWNEPVYVGSTGRFRARIQVHNRQKPGLARFTAYRCRDREHAYELEDRLLKEHKLPMNKRASR